MNGSIDWRGDVLRFWFGLSEAQWFKADDTIDAQVRERFHEMWREKRRLPAHCFLGNSLTALAGAILFDQFPRNMFRGHADQFSTDSLAVQIASGAIDRGYDDEVGKDERVFFYLPFEHSEDIADQRRSIMLFTALGGTRLFDYARKHHDIIARFGRFPHRNLMLGRKPRAEEIAAGDVNPF